MFPTHAAASQIADLARSLGYKVARKAASPYSRSAYVFFEGLCIRVADHPTTKSVHIDVYVDEPRPGAVTLAEALKVIRQPLSPSFENGQPMARRRGMKAKWPRRTLKA